MGWCENVEDTSFFNSSRKWWLDECIFHVLPHPSSTGKEKIRNLTLIIISSLQNSLNSEISTEPCQNLPLGMFESWIALPAFYFRHTELKCFREIWWSKEEYLISRYYLNMFFKVVFICENQPPQMGLSQESLPIYHWVFCFIIQQNCHIILKTLTRLESNKITLRVSKCPAYVWGKDLCF